MSADTSREQGTPDRPEDSPEAQRQGLLGCLGLASNANKAKTATPTDAASGFAADLKKLCRTLSCWACIDTLPGGIGICCSVHVVAVECRSEEAQG
ncbi:hypothetical protein RSOLAG1IB_11894 [Rhizoctonia solani AG-1 IB]|uniref:Uncharacterized protein n=1 Tax=Thanatephorus cucumeris (strain AG1-IB / isolate 7/3/14) TaxID=1108050 RepID=A0A0B7FJA7_THACB|nr:hypothetical protein RSOLAG1IB_11894 [Rhizoctonia solani AG-1 IB]